VNCFTIGGDDQVMINGAAADQELMRSEYYRYPVGGRSAIIYREANAGRIPLPRPV
jgi:hypothetical protein